jgi:hypothetical protein
MAAGYYIKEVAGKGSRSGYSISFEEKESSGLKTRRPCEEVGASTRIFRRLLLEEWEGPKEKKKNRLVVEGGMTP